MPGVRLDGVAEEIRVGTIYCVGRNYRAHAREMGSEIPTEPVLFLKPATALVAEGDPILLPSFSGDVHHEVEMVLLIGMEGKDIPPTEAMDYVIGYGVGLDLTARDLQTEAKKNGLPWAVSKGFDGSAPVSRFLPVEAVPDPQSLELSLSVNGTVRQKSTTAEMIFPVREIVAAVSRYFTLTGGDLIYTGTPEGVGPLAPGDVLELSLGERLRARFDVRA